MLRRNPGRVPSLPPLALRSCGLPPPQDLHNSRVAAPPDPRVRSYSSPSTYLANRDSLSSDTWRFMSAPFRGSGGRRDPTQNIVPSFAPKKRSAVASQNSASASTSTAIHRRPKISPTPFPETKPTTIDGWVVREVANGTAVLQGPNGVWKAARGDTVPGLGTVDSVVLWGSRWIVSTSRGLITTR
jgi:hypothetical protein